MKKKKKFLNIQACQHRKSQVCHPINASGCNQSYGQTAYIARIVSFLKLFYFSVLVAHCYTFKLQGKKKKRTNIYQNHVASKGGLHRRVHALS